MIGSRRTRRTIIGVSVAAVAVVALAGCVVIGFQNTGVVVGKVSISTRICASGSFACADNGNSSVNATAFDSAAGQVLLGYRIPANVVAPSTFTGQNALLVFTESPSYAAELQRLKPAPAGQRWVGYISNNQNYSKNAPVQDDTVMVEFTLLQGSDSSPFVSPFTYRAVTGARSTADPGFSASRPVSCGPSLTDIYDEDPDPMFASLEICVDSPSPAAAVDTNETVPSLDIGILDGARASAAPGELAVLRFTARYAGPASPLADFAFSATTKLPGAVAAATPASLAPNSDSANAVSVAVGVPTNAAPGTYDVTLSAKAPFGLARTGMGKLTVTAAPAGGPGAGPGRPGGGGVTAGGIVKPRLTLILPRAFSAARARKKGITVLIGSTASVRATVQLFQGRRKKALVASSVRLRAPGPTKVLLKSRKLRKGSFRIVVSGTGFAFRRTAVLKK